MRRLLFALCLLLVAAGCDSDALGSGTPFGFATDGTDWASGLVQLADGSLAVVGSAEGVPRPADGTLAHPAVLRFGLDGDLEASAVYRDLGFGGVGAVAPLGDGLAVAVTAQPEDNAPFAFRLLRIDRDGRVRGTLLERTEGHASAVALGALPGGDLVLVLSPGVAGDDAVFRLRPDGAVVWSTMPDGVRNVRAASVGADGAVYLQGAADGGASVLLRLDPASGAERWRVADPAGWTVARIAALADGVARLESRQSFADGSAVRVARFAGDGSPAGAVEVAAAPGSPDGEAQPERRILPGPIAALPDGRLAVGWSESRAALDDPPSTRVAVVGDRVGEAWRFGRDDRWTGLAALVPLADGRLAAAGAVGPAQVSGYGGDDFDVLVTLYAVD